MPEIVDDKSEHCIPFILERLKQHREQYESKGEIPPPSFLGLNGVQGAGKTTLVCGQSLLYLCSGYNVQVLCNISHVFFMMTALQSCLLSANGLDSRRITVFRVQRVISTRQTRYLCVYEAN